MRIETSGGHLKNWAPRHRHRDATKLRRDNVGINSELCACAIFLKCLRVVGNCWRGDKMIFRDVFEDRDEKSDGFRSMTIWYIANVTYCKNSFESLTIFCHSSLDSQKVSGKRKYFFRYFVLII